MPVSQEKLFEILKKVERPTRYLGNEINAIKKDLSGIQVKIALVMPETYEIGQSNLGLKILYEVLNRIPHVAAERVYAPWVDCEQVLRQEKIPVFSLENKIPLGEFDLIGVSLPYELSYTNLLTLFDLAGIPFRSENRKNIFPLVVGGGNQAFNPEPVADFFDAFVIGDGEETSVKIVEKLLEFKKSPQPPFDKVGLLHDLTKIQGLYVPSFFNVTYKEDQTIAAITPQFEDYVGVKKATVSNLDDAAFPIASVVPSMKTVHDRLAVEVQRGCVRGCRFCQAGYIYRPERQRSPEKVLEIIEQALPKTGDQEISLLSLSVGDYGCLVPLVRELFDRYEKKKISISLPATRTDTFSPEVIQEIKRVRKTGFTIAPEAGTPRMRRVINKGNSREDLYQTVENIFKEGWQLIKFYYMCGLPFETFEDLTGIVEEAEAALEIGRKYSRKVRINLSVSPHVPKPHTPFQWEPQDSIELTQKKIAWIKSKLTSRAVEFKYHDAYTSHLEGIFSRGDRRLSVVIEKAWELGCRFDSWHEHFNFGKWVDAFNACGIDRHFYVSRERSREEILPWDHLFVDLKKDFLWEEKMAAQKESFVEDCSTARCTDCGICDFHEVKNINYMKSPQPPFDKVGHSFSSPLRKGGLGGILSGEETITQFSTRGRKLKEFKMEKIKGKGDEHISSFSPLPKVYTSYRCRFTKLGLTAFFSHLEVMGILKRALARAQVPIRFSEGYHPQPKLSLGQALPVGVESYSEFFDIEIEGSFNSAGLKDRLNVLLPSGLKVESCEKLDSQAPSVSAETKGAVWQMELHESYPGGEESLKDRVQWLREQPELMVTRRREDGSKKVDISPFIASLEACSDRSLTLVTRHLPQGSTRPQEVLGRLLEGSEEMLKKVRVIKVESLLRNSCATNSSLI